LNRSQFPDISNFDAPLKVAEIVLAFKLPLNVDAPLKDAEIFGASILPFKVDAPLKLILKQSETIQLASKIINEGDIGKVAVVDGAMLQVTLNSDVQAYNTNWKQLAKPGENILMIMDNEGLATIGDEVVIENECLCLKKDKSSLKCDIILCNL